MMQTLEMRVHRVVVRRARERLRRDARVLRQLRVALEKSEKG
jgi:hypothetical protein